MRRFVLSLASAGIVLAASAVATAGVISDNSFNTGDHYSYDGGWGGGATGWVAASNLTRTHSLTSDSLDGNGAAKFDSTASTNPATNYWRSWFGLGWFGINNSQAVADPSKIAFSFDAKVTNIGNNIPGAVNFQITAFHSGADVGWAQQNQQVGNKTVTLTTSWAHYSVLLSDFGAFDLSTNRNFFVLQTNMSADGGSGYAGFNTTGTSSLYLDNVKLETVPEPGTLALVGLTPSLALLRRRRRA